MSGVYTYKTYERSFGNGSLKDAAEKYYGGCASPTQASADQPAENTNTQQIGQGVSAGIGGQASPLLEVYQASHAVAGYLLREVTAKKARELAATELSRVIARGLQDKIQSAMKARPGFWNIDSVHYEVQLLIHTREEFKQAVRAEAKKLLENALS